MSLGVWRFESEDQDKGRRERKRLLNIAQQLSRAIPYTSKFLRRTIFVDCYFQTFRRNNFHGSRVSSIRWSKILQA